MNDSSDTAPTRERLDALRAYAFFTPTRAASRMNLIYMVGFNALVLGVMAWGRATLVHFVVQIVFGIVPWVFLRSHKHGRAVMGTLGYFVSLANTGGLASPILAAGVPLVAGAALGAMHARHRKTLLVAFVTGLVATGALTMSPWLPLPAPLVGHDGQVGVPYIFLALVSVGSACLAAYRVGGRLSQVHERMVIELAERREEICAENEDRSRALEGIAGLLALSGGFIPPTVNCRERDPECDLDYVPNAARPADIRTALCNCIGFGSKNSALVVKKFEV